MSAEPELKRRLVRPANDNAEDAQNSAEQPVSSAGQGLEAQSASTGNCSANPVLPGGPGSTVQLSSGVSEDVPPEGLACRKGSAGKHCSPQTIALHFPANLPVQRVEVELFAELLESLLPAANDNGEDGA